MSPRPKIILAALVGLLLGTWRPAIAQALDTAEIIQTGRTIIPSPFVVTDNATPTIASGEITRNDEIFRVPVRYGRVGFLQNDILRTGLVNSDRVIIPRGTPVFAAPFGYVTTPGADGNAVAWGYRSAWCAIGPDQRGYCMLRPFRGNDTLLGYMPQDGSPYAPRLSEMYLPTPGSPAEVREDPSAGVHFPHMELIVTFDRWERDEVDFRFTLSAGGEATEFKSATRAREPDGSAILRVGETAIRLVRGSNNRTAIVSQSPN